MKKIVLVFLAITVFACKENKKKEEEKKTTKTEEPKQEAKSKKEIVLPPNIVQVNDEKIEFIEEGITINKIQIVDNKNDSYLFKIFMNTTDVEKVMNGNFSFFIQAFPYEDDKELLDDAHKKRGMVTYWASLKNLKKYKDEYVFFRSVKSKIDVYEKMNFGIRNTVDKKNIAMTSFEDVILKK